MLGSPILYLKGMRILMFQLSGFYYKALGCAGKVQDVGSFNVGALMIRTGSSGLLSVTMV